MKKAFVLLFLIVIITACNKDDEITTTGFLEGVVTDIANGELLPDVRLIVFDANTKAPTGKSFVTDIAGAYEIEIDPGTYYLKLYKLGYNNIPKPGISTIPLAVNLNKSTSTNFEMSKSDITDGGMISGNVNNTDGALTGVLTIAENNEYAFSSVSDGEGNYYIYNVLPGEYSVKGWMSGFNSEIQTVTINPNSVVTDVDLQLTNNANSVVTGTITFLATENIEVDVSLVHPKTKETIPGLSTSTENFNYTISNVPDGTYLGRASFENDAKVMDPDWIVKNGEPFISIAGADDILNFSITNSVTLMSPTNDNTSISPLEIPLGSAIFTWEPYPSASDYVIEVMDANGEIIWGGFSNDWGTRNVVIPSSQTTVNFNDDNTASASLIQGDVYRWRIYACKDDVTSATGWRLISASEDQMGLIKIME